MNKFEVLWYTDPEDMNYENKEFDTKEEAISFYNEHKDDADKYDFWITERDEDWYVVDDIIVEEKNGFKKGTPIVEEDESVLSRGIYDVVIKYYPSVGTRYVIKAGGESVAEFTSLSDAREYIQAHIDDIKLDESVGLEAVSLDGIIAGAEEIAKKLNLPDDKFAKETRKNFCEDIYYAYTRSLKPISHTGEDGKQYVYSDPNKNEYTLDLDSVKNNVGGNLASWFANEIKLPTTAPTEWQKEVEDMVDGKFKEKYSGNPLKEATEDVLTTVKDHYGVVDTLYKGRTYNRAAIGKPINSTTKEKTLKWVPDHGKSLDALNHDLGNTGSAGDAAGAGMGMGEAIEKDYVYSVVTDLDLYDQDVENLKPFQLKLLPDRTKTDSADHIEIFFKGTKENIARYLDEYVGGIQIVDDYLEEVDEELITEEKVYSIRRADGNDWIEIDRTNNEKRAIQLANEADGWYEIVDEENPVDGLKF